MLLGAIVQASISQRANRSSASHQFRPASSLQCGAPLESAKPMNGLAHRLSTGTAGRMRFGFYCAVVFVVAASCLSGCGGIFYARTSTGAFSGKLDVEWIAPNEFIYRPDKDDPLIYVDSTGRSIRPRTMYTDGGSIPRLFWSSPNLGPWDFAPGYIIHDWLFVQHHCREADWQAIDFERSAVILAEAIKTQMVKSPDAHPTVVWAIYEAVRSPIARRLWEEGECRRPPPETIGMIPKGAVGAPVPRPVTIMTIDFGAKAKSNQ